MRRTTADFMPSTLKSLLHRALVSLEYRTRISILRRPPLTPPAWLHCVGDGDFASNSFFPYMSNSELALSMVRWLAREDRAPRIRAGVPLPPLILLTRQQMKTIFLVLEVLLPLSVIAMGTGVWWRRR